MELFDKPRSRTLRTEIVDILRDAIVTGRLKPGEHLKETAVAEQLSVSRSPVREAFRQLEQEGLIVSIPNQGSFVKVFDEQDVREIFTLRAVLEDLACEIVLKEGKLRPADLERLEMYIDWQRQAIAASDFDGLTKLDMEFHQFLCEKSGFERLVKMWQGLRAQIQVFFYQRFQALDEVPETVATDHTAIMQALRQGDPALFSQINKEVNERVAEECIQVMRSMREESSSPELGRQYAAERALL
jgi:DNA-binding GntR family transcriptional regulator